MTVVALIQARMTSARLRGKVLADVDGKPLLVRVAQRAALIAGLDDCAVLLSGDVSGEAIVHVCQDYRVPVLVCPDLKNEDVLGRYARAVIHGEADIVLRLTGDCPLLDPAVCSEVVELLLRQPEIDYAGATQPESEWADGLDCEAIRGSVILEMNECAKEPDDREHVTSWIRRQPHRCLYLPCPEDLRPYKWSVDTMEDLRHVREIYAVLPQGQPTSWWATLLASQQLCSGRTAMNWREILGAGSS